MTATDTTHVVTILGGDAVLRARIRSPGELEAAVARGLARGALDACAARVWPDRRLADRFKYRVLPRATYHRRRRLKAGESERVERLARIVALAERAWDGERAAARSFLTAPHPLLEGRAPIEAALTELGARRVEAILAAIGHGLPV